MRHSIFQLSLLFLGGCVLFSSPAAEDVVKLDLKIDAPFSEATLSISEESPSNFAIQYTASSENLTESGLETISPEAFAELQILVAQNHPWTFDQEYIFNGMMDGTTYTVTTYYKDGTKGSVRCYGTCPDEITEIRNRILELWGKKVLQIGI